MDSRSAIGTNPGYAIAAGYYLGYPGTVPAADFNVDTELTMLMKIEFSDRVLSLPS